MNTTIPNLDGEVVTVSLAGETQSFIVHPTILKDGLHEDAWTVTHKESKMACGAFASPELALDFAQQLEPLTDWTRDALELARDQKLEKRVNRIRKKYMKEQRRCYTGLRVDIERARWLSRRKRR